MQHGTGHNYGPCMVRRLIWRVMFPSFTVGCECSCHLPRNGGKETLPCSGAFWAMPHLGYNHRLVIPWDLVLKNPMSKTCFRHFSAFLHDFLLLKAQDDA